MTTAEQKSIDALTKLIGEIKTANNTFRESITIMVQGISDKVDKKHVPLNLENEIVFSVKDAVAKALSSTLTNSYNSPLVKYANNVVERYQKDIEGIFDKVVQEGIKTDEFKERVREVLLNKIAKTVISGIDGSIDKTINLMKQDSVFRSRLTLAVNGLVNEFLNRN